MATTLTSKDGAAPVAGVPDPALLVVEDNEDNRYVLSQQLNIHGYDNITIATNGHEALNILGSKSFDLVLLDIMMPDLNGYEVLERMRSSSELRNIPVIMISGIGELDSVVRCIELGAEDYLPKPFEPTLLRARVRATLERKRLILPRRPLSLPTGTKLWNSVWQINLVKSSVWEGCGASFLHKWLI